MIFFTYFLINWLAACLFNFQHEYIIWLFPYWIIYFELGYYHHQHGIRINASYAELLFALGGLFVLSYAECLFYKEIGWSTLENSPCHLIASAYCFCVIVLLIKEQQSSTVCNRTSWLTMIGDYSFGIYCSHMFVITFALSIIAKIIPHNTFFTSMCTSFMACALTIGASITVFKAVEKILPIKVIKYLGIK